MALDNDLQNALANLEQGAVWVTINPDTDDVDITTQDGVDLNVIRNFSEQETDILGVYDIITTGDAAEFELTLQDSSLEVLDVLFPGGETDGTTYVGIGQSAGQGMRQYAIEMQFRPYQSKDSDTDLVELWNCVPNGDPTRATQKDSPWNWSQPMRALPDPTKEDGNLIGRIYHPSR